MDEPYESDNFVSEEVIVPKSKEKQGTKNKQSSRTGSVKREGRGESRSVSKVGSQDTRRKLEKKSHLMDEGLEYGSIPKPKGRLTEEETVPENGLDCMDIELDELDKKYSYC